MTRYFLSTVILLQFATIGLGNSRLERLLLQLDSAATDSTRLYFINDISRNHRCIAPQKSLEYAEKGVLKFCSYSFFIQGGILSPSLS